MGETWVTGRPVTPLAADAGAQTNDAVAELARVATDLRRQAAGFVS